MRWFATILISLALLGAAPAVSAHGALIINEFDVYAISDFEGQEDSFPWEGFEIWDIYAGDAYSQTHQSHGVYFKANFAGDGTLRPLGGQLWTLDFSFKVGGAVIERQIVHDGAEVTTTFEEFESQIADGNVFQVRAWTPVMDWEGKSITDITVVSSVDGERRDSAPGGIHLPVLGNEVPINVPATPVFPEMGEGRLVQSVPLTGAAKFLDVAVTPGADNWFNFTVKNPLSVQGQHFMVKPVSFDGWTITGAPNPVSIEGGGTATFRMQLTPDSGLTAPLIMDFVTDIGGKDTFYAFVSQNGTQVSDDVAMALNGTVPSPTNVETPALPLVWLGLILVAFAARKRS